MNVRMLPAASAAGIPPGTPAAGTVVLPGPENATHAPHDKEQHGGSDDVHDDLLYHNSQLPRLNTMKAHIQASRVLYTTENATHPQLPVSCRIAASVARHGK